VPNSSLVNVKPIALFAMFIWIKIPSVNAAELSNNKLNKQITSKSNTNNYTKMINEEFLLFLAESENKNGNMIDPLDMLDIDLDQNETLEKLELEKIKAKPNQKVKEINDVKELEEKR
jgi:hypothetical protein